MNLLIKLETLLKFMFLLVITIRLTVLNFLPIIIGLTLLKNRITLSSRVTTLDDEFIFVPYVLNGRFEEALDTDDIDLAFQIK